MRLNGVTEVPALAKRLFATKTKHVISGVCEANETRVSKRAGTRVLGDLLLNALASSSTVALVTPPDSNRCCIR